jgi:Icc protein
MPVSLPPISRRGFLAGSLGVAASFWAQRLGAARAEAVRDANRFALLSDLHIAAERGLVVRGVNMADNFSAVCGEVGALANPPATVLVNGDCAYLTGEAGDYAALLGLLKPLREGGAAVHLAMGNHDSREHFWAAIPADDVAKGATPGRQVIVVESPRADWYVLDSLQTTNQTPGSLGEEQLAWLAKSLDVRPGKNAIVMVHHNPEAIAKPPQKPTGLLDAEALLGVLSPRRQVKALIYGHTHAYSVSKREDGLHLVNLPPTAYVFNKEKPSGWVDVNLAENAATIELRCLDVKHPQHGEKSTLEWRRG